MSNDEVLSGLRAFVAVVDGGSFSAAAPRLGISRSAVSKAVSRLEERRRVRLLERSQCQLRLTEAGEALLSYARRALDALAAAEEALSVGTGSTVGRVRLSAPPLLGRLWLMPALFALRRHHAELVFDIEFSTRASELVAEGVDLALRVGALPSRAEWVSRRLGQQPTVLVAAPAYLVDHDLPASASDLHAHICLLQSRGGGWPWLSQPLQAREQIALGDCAALCEAALAGQGIALLPRWLVAEHLQSGALRAVLERERPPVLPIQLVWPRGQHLPRRVRTVIDALSIAMASDSRFAE
ncbi:LysR family transcriptional regulator [Stenotrophomonas maltophilia]|uniref:LysR family transcriptional regulator n=1 Tax=Stenotrophomonas maltophilia TaxID=40324 RepID=UPI0021C0417F|nr:LysR family transcriptional regulator [Stenotrophomonas maltophilia]UXL28955.1 LysR family transcriptional regulator [Stenotrophomonas maltophilia]